MSYVQEPWHLQEDGPGGNYEWWFGSEDGGQILILPADTDPGYTRGTVIAIIPLAWPTDRDPDVSRETARRIIACVNFCAGIPTEEIERVANCEHEWTVGPLFTGCRRCFTIRGTRRTEES